MLAFSLVNWLANVSLLKLSSITIQQDVTNTKLWVAMFILTGNQSQLCMLFLVIKAVFIEK